MRLIVSAIFLVLTFFICGGPALAVQPEAPEQEIVGEILGVPVPRQNYYFIKASVLIFGNKWGAPVKTKEEIENATWEQLLLSLVSFNEDITVPQEELDAEITKTLASEGAAFDWKADAAAYESWVKEKTNLPVNVFAEEIRHLLQVQKLRARVMDSIDPQVSEAEAHQKFLNEHNTLSVELVEFPDAETAAAFYKNAAGNAAFWEREKKRHPRDFRRPGFVSLEFLIDLWKIPADACYKMMQREIGGVYPPRPIYKGYAVFKVLEKRPADEALFASLKDSYVEKVRNIKKVEGLNAWFKTLKEQAKIKIYPVSQEAGPVKTQ